MDLPQGLEKTVGFHFKFKGVIFCDQKAFLESAFYQFRNFLWEKKSEELR